MKRPRAGFTLIELMVAIAVLVVITAIVFGALWQVSGTVEVAEELTEEVRLHQFLARQFREVLAAAYIDPAGARAEYQFLGEEEGGPFGPADKLRFVTTESLSGTRALPGVYKVVEIGIDTGEEAQDLSGVSDGDEAPRVALVYQETPLVVEEDEFGGTSYEPNPEDFVSWRLPVQSFDVQFYDDEEWVESWDTLSTRMLPWAVRIRINFAKDNEAIQAERALGINSSEEADYQITVPLPLGMGAMEQFVPPNPAEAADQEEANGLAPAQS